MITVRQIRKMTNEHVKNIDDSFEIEKLAAKINFLAGAIAVLKLLNKNDLRFMNTVKYEEPKS